MACRFLFIKPFLLTRANGGERSLIEYFQWLLSEDHEVEVRIAIPLQRRKEVEAILKSEGTPLIRSSYGYIYRLGGVKCEIHFGKDLILLEKNQTTYIEEMFRDMIDRSRPDFVLSHYTDFFATSAALKWNPDRNFIFLTDDEYPRLPNLDRYPTIQNEYQKIKHLMVASPYLKASAENGFPKARVHYLPNRIEGLEREPNPKLGDHWLFVNPCQQKGVDFAVELARRLPEEKFLFLEYWGTYSKEGLPPNIDCVPRQKDIWSTLAKSKGVIIPSHWNESFGRVALEAMAAGVPVVASQTGNLPETVGEGGICLPHNLDLWASYLLKPQDFWIAQTQKGFRRLKTFQAKAERRFWALKAYLKIYDIKKTEFAKSSTTKIDTTLQY